MASICDGSRALAAASYGLSFDIDAMITLDIEDQAKFYPPGSRFYVIRRGSHTSASDASSASRQLISSRSTTLALGEMVSKFFLEKCRRGFEPAQMAAVHEHD